MNGIVKKLITFAMIGVMTFELLATLPGVGVRNVEAVSGIPIDEEHFPDENFRKFLLNESDGYGNYKYDANSDGYFSAEEISNIWSINCPAQGVKSFIGLNYFTNLTDFISGMNPISTLDLSGNPKLRDITINGSNLTSLNLSGCPNLIALGLHHNDTLSSIDITKCSKIVNIECSDNKLTSLTISGKTNLLYLYCKNNKITTLDLRNSSLSNARVNPADGDYMKEPLVYCDASVKIIRNDSDVNDNSSKSSNTKKPAATAKTPATTKKYSNEWVNGKWYNADGSQTYKGTMSWKKNSKGWWIEDSAGWYPTSKWQKIDGKWYYFTADGYMDYSEYRDGCWLGSDGAWVESYSGGKWSLDSTGWWYSDSSGWYPANQWLWIDGTNYNFNSKGYCTNP